MARRKPRFLANDLQLLEDRAQPSVVKVTPPPTANDDFIDTDGNNPVAVSVLDNDAAVSPNTLVASSISIVSNPSHGHVSLDSATGEVTYTAVGFFQGTDTFRYNVKDSAGAQSNTATVTIVVNRPIANDDFVETTANTLIDISVLDNDTDPDGNSEIDPTSVNVTTIPGHGTVTVDPSGVVTYTPATDFTGTDTFKYTITDFPGASSKPGTVTVVVDGSTTVTAPTANDDAADTDGTNPVSVDILANDAAAAGLTLDPATVTIVTAPTQGKVTIDGAGQATYTATGFFMGTDSFTYTVKDSEGTTSNTATVSIVVNRPTANDDFIDTDGNNPVEIDVLANDSDPDGNDQLNPSSVQVVSAPAHGTTSIDPSTGKITYTSTGFFQGTDTFQYTVTDFPGAESAPATVTVVVNRPTPNDDASATTGSNPVIIDVLANDTDPDGNDELNPASVAVVGSPSHGSVTVDSTSGQITYTPNGNFIGTDVFTYTVTDFPGAVSNTATVRVRNDSPSDSQVTVVGAGIGGGPRVVVYNSDGTVKDSFFAYDPSFAGGVRVATGDVNGDGVPDIVTAAGVGGGPHIKIFDGVTQKLISSFFAYDPSFRGGVTVAVADVNGDGHADIITGAGAGGGPHVKVFSGLDNSVIYSFFAFNSAFRGGVNIAVGDVDGDGRADIIAGAGASLGNLDIVPEPTVKVFRGSDGSQSQGFTPFDPSFRGGVSVAAGDFNGDGHDDIVTGAGPGGGPHVKIFDGNGGPLIRSFFAYSARFLGGVRVAAGDVNGDGTADLIVAPGGGQSLPTLVFSGDDFSQLHSTSPFGSFNGGVFVGGPG